MKLLFNHVATIALFVELATAAVPKSPQHHKHHHAQDAHTKDQVTDSPNSDPNAATSTVTTTQTHTSTAYHYTSTPEAPSSANAATCFNNYPDTFEAIQHFCNHANLTLPSKFASNGVTVSDQKVWIDANCSTTAYLDVPGCQDIFYNMCASDEAEQAEETHGCLVFHSLGGLGIYGH